MRGLLQGVSVGLLALLVGVGCGSSSDDAAIEPAPQVPQEANPEPETDLAELSEPLTVPGLISPTTPESIVAQAGPEPGKALGRDDPFAPVVVAARPAPAAPVDPPAEVVEADDEESAPTPPTAAPPEPPQPTNALAVRISGIVQIGNTIRAIVDDPNESVSRHVGAGQFVSNGRVLVKNIDIGSEPPTVLLEEVGIEVRKSVGEVVSTEATVDDIGLGTGFSPVISRSSVLPNVPPPPPSGI